MESTRTLSSVCLNLEDIDQLVQLIISWCSIKKIDASDRPIARRTARRPQATFASAIQIQGDVATVTREVDGGLEVIELDLPAVVTTDLRLNEPRYVTLPSIMKAKKKPIDTVTPDDLGVDPATRLKMLRFVEPAARKAGVRVADVAALVDKLKNEAKVI